MKKQTKLIDTQYFKSYEIIYSYKAEQFGIDNTPTDDVVIANLNYTLQRLNSIRERYGHKIVISSGYRCEELNRIVGGVKDSKHKTGLAVDLKWDKELFDFIKDNCSYDKLILEQSGDTKWIHIQFRLDKSTERHLTYYEEK